MDELTTIAVFCLLGMVVVLAVLIKTQAVQRFDTWLLSGIQKNIAGKQTRGGRKANSAMRDLTALGGDMFSAIVLISGSILLLSQSNSAGLWFFGALILGARFSGFAIKHLMRRERPPVAGQAADIFTSSFPSIHTQMSFVTAFAIAGLLSPTELGSTYALLFGAGASALVGMTRLYLAVHWPTDVLAGWLLGLSTCLFGICILPL